MKQQILQFIEDSSSGLIKIGVTVLIILFAYFAIRIYRRYIDKTAAKHHFAEQRTNSILKLGQIGIIGVAVFIISNVLGFGIQGIFIATSSFFAVVGIAFFAVWSMLSNITASVLIYFAFPYRIGDRIRVENEPAYSGKLQDITLMHLRVRTPGGSLITIPANVAIQKIITVESEKDYQDRIAEAEAEKHSKGDDA